MFVFYLGVAGRQPLQGYAAPPISFIICNQLICLYAMIVHLEMGNKYHIISCIMTVGVEALDCNSDVVKEILRLPHVQPAMLISAQTRVARSMEDRW